MTFWNRSLPGMPGMQKPANPYGAGTNAHYANEFDQAFGKGVWGDKSLLDQQSQFGAQPQEIARRQGIVNDQHSRSNGPGAMFGGIQNTPGAMTGGFNQNSAGIDPIYNTPFNSQQSQQPGQAAQTAPSWASADRQGIIKNFYNQNQGDPKAISDAMRQYGVSNQDFMGATGMDQAGFDKYFDPVFGKQAQEKSYLETLAEEYKNADLGGSGGNVDPNGLREHDGYQYVPLWNRDGGGTTEGSDGAAPTFKGFQRIVKGKGQPGDWVELFDDKGAYQSKYQIEKPDFFDKYMDKIILAGIAAGVGATALGLGGAPAAGVEAGGVAGGTGISGTLPQMAMPPGMGATPFVSSIPGVTAGGGITGGLTLPNILKVATTALGLTGGGNSGGCNSGGNSGGGNSGGGGTSLLDIIGGGLDASRQGQASDRMLEWMNTRQKMVDDLYKPGSPEYNALWDEMSRKDAAAGRNSQYGPRSVDLAGRIAQIKADQNVRMTGALARPYSNALDQNASKYAGLQAALGKALESGAINDMASLVKWLEQNYNIGTNAGGGAPGTNPGGYTGADGERYNNPSAYDTEDANRYELSPDYEDGSYGGY